MQLKSSFIFCSSSTELKINASNCEMLTLQDLKLINHSVLRLVLNYLLQETKVKQVAAVSWLPVCKWPKCAPLCPKVRTFWEISKSRAFETQSNDF